MIARELMAKARRAAAIQVPKQPESGSEQPASRWFAPTLNLSYDPPMDDSVRWTVKVSPYTDEAVRTYLGRRGRSARALSRLVEEALRAQIFEKSVERVKSLTAGVSPAKLQGIVNEAVRYARRAR